MKESARSAHAPSLRPGCLTIRDTGCFGRALFGLRMISCRALRNRTAFIALASLTTLVSACGSAETPSSTGSSGGSSPSAGAFGISGASSGGSWSGSGGSVSGSGGADTAGSGQAGGAGSGGSSGAGRGGMPGSSGGTSGGSFGGAGNAPRAGAGGSGGTTASAGAPSNASGASAGGAAGAGSDLSSQYPCDGTTTGYDAVVTQSGSTYRVMHGGSEVYSGADFQQALSRAYASLSSGRTRLESVLVQASGDIPVDRAARYPELHALERLRNGERERDALGLRPLALLCPECAGHRDPQFENDGLSAVRHLLPSNQRYSPRSHRVAAHRPSRDWDSSG